MKKEIRKTSPKVSGKYPYIRKMFQNVRVLEHFLYKVWNFCLMKMSGKCSKTCFWNIFRMYGHFPDTFGDVFRISFFIGLLNYQPLAHAIRQVSTILDDDEEDPYWKDAPDYFKNYTLSATKTEGH